VTFGGFVLRWLSAWGQRSLKDKMSRLLFPFNVFQLLIAKQSIAYCWQSTKEREYSQFVPSTWFKVGISSDIVVFLVNGLWAIILNMTQVKTRYGWKSAVPIIADGVTFLAMLFFLPGFAQRLGEPSGWNALLLILVYLLFCVGVYLIRKLESHEENSRWQPPSIFLNPRVRAVLAFLFGLLMMTTVAYQIGYFESIQSIGTSTLDEGDSSALFVYMPGALLGFSMLYILVLAFPVQSNISADSKHFHILALLGLVLANGMLLFTTAQARGMSTVLGLADGVEFYMASLLVLLLSFAPPRLLYQNKQPYPYGLISFLILLLIAAWQVVY
jgi:Ca2+/Na+ antiporter